MEYRSDTTLTTMKKCFKCGNTKPLAEFYKHSEMADGHLNKCRECTKKDVQRNYQSNRQYYKKYERERNQKPERKKYNSIKSKKWRLDNPARSAEIKKDWVNKNPAKSAKIKKDWINKNDLKRKAHNAVNNALRDGRLRKLPCQICGDPNSEAHHRDYSKPLDIVWLCDFHHKQEHNKKREATCKNLDHGQHCSRLALWQ